jgi:hypothetical protein
VAEAVREENAMVGALVGHARPTALEGDRLTVCFPEEQAFSRKKAEANRDLVQTAIRGLTGHTLSVVYELSGDAHPDQPVSLDEDELIARLREELGAEEVLDDDPSD